jgi:hypothetical protein
MRVPHVDGRVQRRSAQPARGDGRHQRWVHERVHRCPPAHPAVVRGSRRVRMRPVPGARGPTGRDELPHPAGHPELLGVCRRVRPAGSDVRADRRLDPAGAPVPGLGLVRLLLRPERPDVVHLERGPQGGQPAVRVRRGPDLRLDRHHLVARPRRRLVGLLRRPRDLFVPPVSRPGDRRSGGLPRRRGTPSPGSRMRRDRPAGPHPRLPGFERSAARGTLPCRGWCRGGVAASPNQPRRRRRRRT